MYQCITMLVHVSSTSFTCEHMQDVLHDFEVKLCYCGGVDADADADDYDDDDDSDDDNDGKQCDYKGVGCG